MYKIRTLISDILSLLIPKDNEGIYTWTEIAAGLLVLGFICFAMTLDGG